MIERIPPFVCCSHSSMSLSIASLLAILSITRAAFAQSPTSGTPSTTPIEPSTNLESYLYDYGMTLETSLLGAAYPTNLSSSLSPFSPTSSSTSASLIAITGTSSSTPPQNATASASTAAHARPTNTRPCNGYAEFCNRKFSNVSMVVAHNSPFVVPNNAASNQDLKVLTQLEDGVRGCKCARIALPILNANDFLKCNSRHIILTPL